MNFPLQNINRQYLRIIIILIILFSYSSGYTQTINQIAPIQKNITGDVAEGYIFITQSSLNPLDTYPTGLCMMDSEGEPVFYKAFTSQTSAPYIRKFASDFKLQPSGLFSYNILKETGGIIIYLLDSNFFIADSIQCINDVYTDGHDFLHFPDGSYHLIGTELRIMDLSGIETINGIPGNEDALVTGNVIQRFDPQKNLKFEWKSLDNFAISDVYTVYFTDPSQLDFSHCNSIEVDNDGNYLLSFRNLHEVTKIDSSSGEIIWRLGGKQNQFTFLGDTMLFTSQHDARRINNGNLTLFDNGTYSSTPIARAIEYELDEINKTAMAVWQFQEPFGYSSEYIGNTQRLSNGNTLIDWGGNFPLEETISFSEVDAFGNTVMELDFVSHNFISYRAVKQELPFVIDRPDIVCDGENKTLSAPDGYATYNWNTGEISQSITIVDTGTYQVWVNQGIGFLSSELYYISDIDSMCLTTHIKNTKDPNLHIFPNPASDLLFINYPSEGKRNVQIYSFNGQLIKEAELNFIQKNTTCNIDIRQFPSGFYFLKINGMSKKFIKHP